MTLGWVMTLKVHQNQTSMLLSMSHVSHNLSMNCISILAEAPAPIVQPLPQDKASLLRHLEKTNPEALALARDWDDVACKLTQAESKLAK